MEFRGPRKLTELVEQFRGFAELAKVYLEKFELSGFAGVEPLEFTKIHGSLTMVLGDTEVNRLRHALLPEKEGEFPPTTEKTLEEVYKLAGKLTEILEKLTECMELFERYKLTASEQGLRTSSGAQLSYGYLRELNELYSHLWLHWQNSALEGRVKEVVEFLAELMHLDSPQLLKDTKKIYLQHQKNGRAHLVALLHRLLLQNTLDSQQGLQEGREIIRQIIKDVEKLKTRSLLRGQEELFPGLLERGNPNKEKNLLQRLIQKWNLVPDFLARPLPVLLAELTGQPLASWEKKKLSPESLVREAMQLLTAMDKGKKHGALLLWKVTSRPVGYNLWNLISRETLEEQDLVQERGVGVNLKHLERTKTIFQLPPGQERMELTLLAERHDPEKPEENLLYILETLDGENWHFLIPWNILPGTRPVKSMPASWFEGVEKKERTPSRRVLCYNLLLESEVFKKLEPPFLNLSFLSREEVHREEAQWRALRTGIRQKILELIKARLEGSQKLSLGDLLRIIRENRLYEKVINIITEQISLQDFLLGADQISLEKMEQIRAEVFFSYFREIEKMQKRIRHEVLETFAKDHQEKLERELGTGEIPYSREALARNRMLQSLEEVFDSVLENYINRKSNVYLNIDRKIELLKKTLLK